MRNGTKILDAARRLITEAGPTVSMHEIARAADVAVGTLYRHYPTKAELVAAALADAVTEIAEIAEGARSNVHDGRPAVEELDQLLRYVIARSANDHALKLAATTLGAALPRIDAAAAALALPAATGDPPELRALRAVSDLLTAAQDAGDICADRTLLDLVDLIDGAPTTSDPQRTRRYADIVAAGLRAVDPEPPRV